MKIRFILNPNSGNLRRSPGTVRLVRAYADRRPGAAELVMTARAGHATALAAEAVDAGAETVVAVGGDGTMNEVARALVGTPAALGLVPCGSGNGLARHLGIPLDPARALALLEPGTTRLIDHGRINGHPFFCAAGTGFEAHIAAIFNRRTRRGFLSYLTVSAREFGRYRPETYAVAIGPGEPLRLEAFTVTVANASQYGNGAHIAPGAEVDDGRLDFVAIPPVGLAGGARLLLRLFRRRIRSARGVVSLAAPAFELSAGRPLAFHADGEPHPPAERLSVTVVPRSLRVIVPSR